MYQQKYFRPGEIQFNILRNVIPVGTEPLTIDAETEELYEEPKTKKRGRPRKADKEEVKIAAKADQAKAEEVQAGNTIMTNNSPVIDRYDQTTRALQETVYQIDQLAGELKYELDHVRTMKGTSITSKVKYDAITGLGSTVGQLLRGKIDAIKEINKSITDSNNIEIKRFKELGEREADKNSDARMSELYKAYINMPVGTYQSPFPNIVYIVIGDTHGVN